MSNFITPEDYTASLHSEILDSLIRANPATLETLEDRAIAEMESYLRLRYDCAKIFEARSDERHPCLILPRIRAPSTSPSTMPFASTTPKR